MIVVTSLRMAARSISAATRDGLSWNLILGTSMKVCRETPNSVKIGQNYWAVHMKT